MMRESDITPGYQLRERLAQSGESGALVDLRTVVRE
jgi:hypothetical protein